MNFLKKIKNPVLRAILFIIAFAFSFSGAVNLGWSGFGPAIPFIIALIYFGCHWGMLYRTLTILCFLVVLIPLYMLRKFDSDIYYPRNGETIIVKEDSCLEGEDLSEYGDGIAAFIGPASFCSPEYIAAQSDSPSDAERYTLLPKGTKLIISKTEVSHADLGFASVLRAETPEGLLYHNPSFDYDSSKFLYESGAPVTQDSLRQPFFDYASGLMFWPGAIIFLLPAMIESGTDSVTPDTPIRVRLDDGRIVNGYISSSGSKGRVVHPGDFTTVICKKVNGVKDLMCNLEFQSGELGWTFGASLEGEIYPGIIRLENNIKVPISKNELAP